MSAELKASRHDGTLILTIANPGTHNTLHPDMYAAAVETLSTAERDDSVRAVILTGANQCFCSGADLSALRENRNRDNGAIVDAIDHLHGWIEAIRDCPKPVIAAVEGSASGAGFALALACDLIVAGSTALFDMRTIKAGVTPDGGASWFLTQALPRQMVSEILFEGKPIGAPRLHTLGLVNKVVADGSALDVALSWADELAQLSPDALERMKSLLNIVPGNTLTRQFDAEKRKFIESLFQRDAQAASHVSAAQ